MTMSNAGLTVNDESTTATPNGNSSQRLTKRSRTEENHSISNAVLENKENVFTLGDSDLLDCPICFEPLRSPVFQCDNGHYVCGSCCKKIVHNKCPSCTLPIGSIRCRAIERVVESTFTSCVHNGCTEKVSYLKKHGHEKTCKYVPISCPESGCKYVGMSKCLYTHFAENHRYNSKSIVFNDVTSMRVVYQRKQFFIQERDSKILFSLRHVGDPLGCFVNVSCVAPTTSYMKFSYELTAERGENFINLRSSMELTPDSCAIPAKNKCHLIGNDFLLCKRASNPRHLKWVEIKLVIRRLN